MLAWAGSELGASFGGTMTAPAPPRGTEPSLGLSAGSWGGGGGGGGLAGCAEASPANVTSAVRTAHDVSRRVIRNALLSATRLLALSRGAGLGTSCVSLQCLSNNSTPYSLFRRRQRRAHQQGLVAMSDTSTRSTTLDTARGRALLIRLTSAPGRT